MFLCCNKALGVKVAYFSINKPNKNPYKLKMYGARPTYCKNVKTYLEIG